MSARRHNPEDTGVNANTVLTAHLLWDNLNTRKINQTGRENGK